MSVQFSSVTQLCPTLCDPMDCSTLGFPVHHQLPEFTQIHVHRVDDAIQPSDPLSSPSPPTFNPSQHQGLFKWVSSSHQVAKVLEFPLQHQSFQWTFRTDGSFRIDWLDLLAIPGTLKNLIQCRNSKASILRCSAVFIVQLITTGKTITLTRRTFVSKVMSLLFNRLSRFGEGDGTPLQYSCLENPRDGGALWAAVHWVSKSRTRLSDFTFPFHFHALEKEMATHSSVLAWRIPGTGEPGGLLSMGSHRVGHDWSDLAAAA